MVGVLSTDSAFTSFELILYRFISFFFIAISIVVDIIIVIRGHVIVIAI